MEQVKHKLGDETGTWVHEIIRGIDSSEVSSRTQIKSMLSAKSFRPSINTPEQANRWLRIFSADIYSRLVEEGVLENKRRPKTINLHYRHGGQTKSRQSPIPAGKTIDEAGLFELAKTLLGQIILEGRVWPCANLSLAVAGFEDGIVGNMGIGAFLVKGGAVKALGSSLHGSSLHDSSSAEVDQDRPSKRARLAASTGIQRFFRNDYMAGYDEEFGAQNSTESEIGLAQGDDAELNVVEEAAATFTQEHEALGIQQEEAAIPSGKLALRQHHVTDIICSLCNQALESADSLQSHQDWHFAKELQDEDRNQAAQQARASVSSASRKPARSSSKRKPGPGKAEKGQKKLSFG